ncbi:MAG TPA: DUF3566 domain-containing protein, partial [Acidimicrobiales bacterium]|nr:DUF3566 domain-containing protein [Acidimicrobiales bacterium]
DTTADPDDTSSMAVSTEPNEPTAPAVSEPGRGRLVTTEEALSRRQRKAASRLRARKVKRVIRRVDAWSVLKVSFLFFLCIYVVSLVASLLLWSAATNADVIDKIESFVEDLGAYETWQFEPDQLFRGVLYGGAVLAVLATGLTALGAVLFNLISDLVGGIRITMIEEPGARAVLRPRKAERLAERVAGPPHDD